MRGPAMTTPSRLAVLLSGNGTTLQNLLDRTADGRLRAEVVLVVSNRYDAFSLQRVVPILDDDTPVALAARVFEQECEAYPEAIRLFAEGRLRVEGRRVRVL